jgi:steroid delta-isomerase-like uncharacterized protein
MTTTRSNEELVRRYVDAFNRGDLEALRRLFTADAKVQGVLGDVGLEDALDVWRQLHQGLAVELTIDAIVAEGDAVAVRYTERGKFVGAFQGRPPTGKSYELVSMEWFTCRDGKISRRWGARDAASQARQIGMVAS